MKAKMHKDGVTRSVFISGATRGIGRAIALKFASKKWDIIAHYHSSLEEAKRLKCDLEKYDVGCTLLKADLSSQKDIKALVKTLKTMKIDSMINNAGSHSICEHFTKLTIEDIEETFMINVFAPILMTSALFANMKNRRFGRIVNISSIAAKYGGSTSSMHYGCSKRALEGVTKTLAKEGAPFNVLVNTVRPGVVDTEFHKKYPKDMNKRISLIPLHRMCRPEEVADIVYYIGSERNNYITNETITIAGGE